MDKVILIKTGWDLDNLIHLNTNGYVKIRKRRNKLGRLIVYEYSKPEYLKANQSEFMCDSLGNLINVFLYNKVDPHFTESFETRIVRNKYLSKLHRSIVKHLDPSVNCEHFKS